MRLHYHALFLLFHAKHSFFLEMRVFFSTEKKVIPPQGELEGIAGETTRIPEPPPTLRA